MVGIDAGSAYHLENSFRAWIQNLYPDIPVLVPDDRQRYSRPCLSVMLGRSEESDLGTLEYSLESRLTVGYHGVTYSDVAKHRGEIEQDLVRKKVIPFYLYDWSCPPPSLMLKPGSGLPAGHYYLAVSAMNRLQTPDESNPCIIDLVTTDQGILWITPALFPTYGYVTKKYRVWLGTSLTDFRYYGEVEAWQADGNRGIAKISTLPAPSPVLPLSKSRFYYSFVHIDNVRVQITRGERDQHWDALLMVQNHVVLTREVQQSNIMQQITADVVVSIGA